MNVLSASQLGLPFARMAVPNLHEKIQLQRVGEHIQRVIREGDPTTGWQGDPFLLATYDKVADVFEIWDEKPNNKGRPLRVLRWDVKKNGLPDVTLLCIKLRDGYIEHVSAREYADRLDREDAKLEADREYVRKEALAEPIDRLAHALRKDVGPDGL